MKYERNKKIGNNQRSDIDSSNQLDNNTYTNGSPKEANYKGDSQRRQTTMNNNPYGKDDDFDASSNSGQGSGKPGYGTQGSGKPGYGAQGSGRQGYGGQGSGDGSGRQGYGGQGSGDGSGKSGYGGQGSGDGSGKSGSGRQGYGGQGSGDGSGRQGYGGQGTGRQGSAEGAGKAGYGGHGSGDVIGRQGYGDGSGKPGYGALGTGRQGYAEGTGRQGYGGQGSGKPGYGAQGSGDVSGEQGLGSQGTGRQGSAEVTGRQGLGEKSGRPGYGAQGSGRPGYGAQGSGDVSGDQGLGDSIGRQKIGEGSGDDSSRQVNRGSKEIPSGGEGMYFYEPDRLNRLEMSPVTEGRQTLNINVNQRSPTARQSVIKTVKNDLNDRTDIGRIPIQQLSINIPTKKTDEIESSPKTIYLGQENIFDLNTKTRDRRMSPNEHQGYMIDRPTDPGLYYDEPRKSNRGNIQIEFPLNEFTKSKMSPNRNQNQDNFMGTEENDEENRRKDKKEKIQRLKTIQSVVYNIPDDGYYDNDNNKFCEKIYRNYGEDMKKLSSKIPPKIGEVQTDRTVIRKTTGFNRTKNEGKLINENIKSMKPSETFNDRHTVIPSINKLSTIILSRNTDINNERATMKNKEIEGANTFDKQKVKDYERKTLMKATTKTNGKFLKIAMAIFSAKGIIYF